MLCPQCQHENRDAAKFCEQCAAPLQQRLCSGCGASVRPSAKFCDECAQAVAEHAAVGAERAPRDYTPKHLADKILTSRSALEGERKQVTVLFADVKGSMEIAEQLDPEQWHAILDRFFQILTEGVHRFEGTVNQYTGDGIMALFGAPIAHEDHAQRACYAALHLRDALKGYSDELRLSQGLDFAVRVGINSGEVIVGKIGDDLRMDYTAQGHTVGLAQRMEQLAAAHSICMSEATSRLVGGYFEARDLGPPTIKGTSEPLRVFELVGIGSHRTRLDVSRSRGLTRFVGRDADIQTIESALQQAIAGNGQVVGVVAEAGTGKSRLCYEFLDRCRAKGLSVIEGHCPAHGKTVPYLPVLEILRSAFQISDSDSGHEARRKIAGELLLLDDSFQQLLPLVFEFLGVPDPSRDPVPLSPEVREHQLSGFLRQLTQARSEREPQVLYLDDAHWIDPGSDAFLARAVEAASGTRTLWLVNFRPEYHADWMSRSFYRQLPLHPLGPEEIAELLTDLLGRDPSLAGLPERIHERTQGNPFFTEEVVVSLAESGSLEGARGAYRLCAPIDQLEIPDAVQALLAARIDRLNPSHKALLQDASVIGKEFRRSVLGRSTQIADEQLSASLAALVQAEFLYEKALYPEAEYAFKHPLTHEVAYESQLVSRRASTHAAVARAIEQIDSTQLDERAALLARHWELAADPTIAAHWHARAARWCALDDPRAARRYWLRVRELLADAPQSAEGDALELEATVQLLSFGWRQGLEYDEARTLLEQGCELAERTGDLRSRILLQADFITVHTSRGDHAEVADLVEETFALAEQTGDARLRVGLRYVKGMYFFYSGNIVAASALLAETADLGYRELTPTTLVRGLPVAWAHGIRAWVLAEQGKLAESAESARRCEEGIRGIGHLEVESWTMSTLSIGTAFAGDAGSALPLVTRAVELAERVGSNLGRIIGHGRLGSVLLLKSRWSEAITELELALRIGGETVSFRATDAFLLSSLAEAHLGAGDLAGARSCAEQALDRATRKTPLWAIPAHLALGRVILAESGRAGREQIEVALASCEALIERTQALFYEPHVHELRAQLARVLGDEALWTHEMNEALKLHTRMGAKGHAQRVTSMLS